MAERYTYVIVGGGLTAASAIEGIRERDGKSPVLLIGAETHTPYHRPPLSKKLWLGKETVDQIFVQRDEFYKSKNVRCAFGAKVVAVDAQAKSVRDANGNEHRYEKLLLATGGTPRRLPIPGADLEGISYFRTLDDYNALRGATSQGKSALVVGAGFIGSEIAAALNQNGVQVTMLFRSDYLVSRVFPESLGRAIQDVYLKRGVRILHRDTPASFEKRGGRFLTRTSGGQEIESDLLVVGVGIAPETALARSAGLALENGIVVNEYLETANPHIYAAGDNAFFPYQALGERTRVEHWDNALSQGKLAGRNMAGAREPYTHMPYFFSDLFEFGYEAVGKVESRLETFADWQKENDTGVVYYLADGRVRGAMMCNVWGKVDAARELIRAGKPRAVADLRGAIRAAA
jgi:NADPH-dependent 2,4-dienoyl-CoA reductase/sulfur reductase-like enzyme